VNSEGVLVSRSFEKSSERGGAIEVTRARLFYSAGGESLEFVRFAESVLKVARKNLVKSGDYYYGAEALSMKQSGQLIVSEVSPQFRKTK
jgi:hypothetical protein